MRYLLAVIAIAAGVGAAQSVEALQYEGRVVVGPDGNGWVSAMFPTSEGGDDVVYYLDVSTGCAAEPLEHDQPCAAAVKALAVTLNGEVVFRKGPLSTTDREEIALHLVGTSDNEIVASAEGERGAAADFAIVALRRAPQAGSAKK